MDLLIERKIDNVGRIVIPKDVRTWLELKEGDRLLIEVANGKIIISKKQ